MAFLYYQGTGCLFKAIFHIPCPGCGMMRAFISILKCNFAEAFYFNALSIPVFIILSIVFSIRGLDILRHQDNYSKLINRIIAPKMIVVLVIITVINWAWNIIKGI